MGILAEIAYLITKGRVMASDNHWDRFFPAPRGGEIPFKKLASAVGQLPSVTIREPWPDEQGAESRENSASAADSQEKPEINLVDAKKPPVNSIRRMNNVHFDEDQGKAYFERGSSCRNQIRLHKLSLPAVTRMALQEMISSRQQESDDLAEKPFLDTSSALKKIPLSSSSPRLHEGQTKQKLSVPVISRRSDDDDDEIGLQSRNRNWLRGRSSQRASFNRRYWSNPIYSLSTEYMRQAGYQSPPFANLLANKRKSAVISFGSVVHTTTSTNEKLEQVGQLASPNANKIQAGASRSFDFADEVERATGSTTDSTNFFDTIDDKSQSESDWREGLVLSNNRLNHRIDDDATAAFRINQLEGSRKTSTVDGERENESKSKNVNWPTNYCNATTIPSISKPRCLTFKKQSTTSSDDTSVKVKGNNFDDRSEWDFYRYQQHRKFGSQQLPRRSYGRLYAKDSIGQRVMLKRRKYLFEKRLLLCKLCLIFAALGLVLAILEAELTALRIVLKTGILSKCLRVGVLLSTIVLVGLILFYHWIEVNIAMVDINAKDWRVVVTGDHVALIVIEVTVCAICPIPANVWFSTTILMEDHRQTKTALMPLDNLLSLPMFLRFYLIGRFMGLYSAQFRDAATRSIARLNRVSVNFAFVMKSLMSKHPLRVLFGFTVVFWIVMSWILVQCERYSDMKTDNEYLNCLWFIVITFMSIGYGDIVPVTYCGRVVAIMTGIMGAGVSSALIAVMSMKLELSRAEKHVNNFMTDTKLNRQRKQAAALILQHTWFIHKWKHSEHAADEIRLRYHQRKFIAAITEFRRVKWEQRRLTEQGNALIDVAKLQSDMNTTMWEMQQVQLNLTQQVDRLTRKVSNMCDLLSSTREGTGRHVASIRRPSKQDEANPELVESAFETFSDEGVRDAERIHLLNAEV